mmetsp:Transcript_61819/g.137776  ORF Transcript_61819/g.137776 Transcript_61819/m.137776 type:complete len:209 (-) Transcript_61819:449-1075(-)
MARHLPLHTTKLSPSRLTRGYLRPRLRRRAQKPRRRRRRKVERSAEAVDTAQAFSVTHAPVHDVAACHCNAPARPVEGHRATLRRRDPSVPGGCKLPLTEAEPLAVCAGRRRRVPDTVDIVKADERVAKVHLKIWQPLCNLQPTPRAQEGLLAQWADHWPTELKVVRQLRGIGCAKVGREKPSRQLKQAIVVEPLGLGSGRAWPSYVL